MKLSHLMFGALAAGIFGTANAQEPSKPTYEKRVYQANDRYYVQRGLPVYLYFSTSPNGQMYPLKSEAHPTDANPMYLDTEGVNYIRSKWAVNPDSKKAVNPQREVMMPIYADGLAPKTLVTFQGAPVYRANGVTYYGQGLGFTLAAKDGVSGVQKTQFALNGGYTDYSGLSNVTQEGAQTLYWYSADNVGNVENTRSKNFTVDVTAPTSSHSLNGIVHNSNILAPSSTIGLSSNDNSSGVAKTYYAFDGGTKKRHYGNISMDGLADGNHTITYYAIDNVKNEASQQSFSFYLDRIAPVTNHTVMGDQYQGKYLFISPRTTVTLASTDNKAGVKTIHYRIDGKERMDYASAISMPNVLGTHVLKYDAIDNVENLSGNKYLTVYMDNKAPNTSISYGAPQFFHRDTLFVTSNTKVTLTPRDYESGVQTTQYATNGGGMNNYSQFTLPNEGYYTITFKSTDNVNNVEEVKTSHCFVDNTPPTISSSFGVEALGTHKGLPVYPNYVRLYMGATDDHTGIKTIYYSINGGAKQAYSSAQSIDVSESSKFKKKQKYEVVITVQDKLGNQAEKTVEFYVGRP